MIRTGINCTYDSWKRLCRDTIDGLNHATWRFDLTTYKTLKLYRIVKNEADPLCWWYIAKNFPYLKSQCITVTRLVSGASSIHTRKMIDNSCRLCISREIEDVNHFLRCSYFDNIRKEMHDDIKNDMSCNNINLLNSIHDDLKLAVLLGMDFPFEKGEI